MIARRHLLLLSLALAPGVVLAAEEKDDGDKAARQEPYVSIPTLTATVNGAGGKRGVMTVQATLYVPAMDQRIRAAKSIPFLLNAFVPALQGFAYSLPPGTPPNIDILARTLQGAADRVLGKGARVLIGGVLVT